MSSFPPVSAFFPGSHVASGNHISRLIFRKVSKNHGEKTSVLGTSKPDIQTSRTVGLLISGARNSKVVIFKRFIDFVPIDLMRLPYVGFSAGRNKNPVNIHGIGPSHCDGIFLLYIIILCLIYCKSCSILGCSPLFYCHHKYWITEVRGTRFAHREGERPRNVDTQYFVLQSVRHNQG